MKPLLSRRTYKIPPALSQMLPLLSLHPQKVQHLRAVPPPPPVFLDLEVADDEQVSPDKLRANLERLYMTVIVVVAAFAKHIACPCSWNEPRRTVKFRVAALSVLLATILALIFPSSRRAMLPPAWHLWKPRAGTLRTLDSLSGAPEAHQGEAVEQEALKFVASFAAITLPEVFRIKSFGYDPSHILPHLGNPDEEKREKSYKCFLDDLKRCEHNFHPGRTVGVATIKENMVSATSSGPASLNLLAKRIRLTALRLAGRMYAARYDITTPEDWDTTMAESDRDMGTLDCKHIVLPHIFPRRHPSPALNSSIPVRGHLGLRTFARILSDPRTRDIPLVPETPAYDVPSTSGISAAARDRLAKEGMGVWHTEVSVLNRLSGRPRAGKDAKGKKQGGWRGQGGKRKAKRKAGKEDHDEEEDGYGCCDLEH
ncbi:hypothetical protein C8Q74DRAFT_1373006 [Fomes fomentarius]|nr:hypothetical protein C8Q74DRAFT_1373006 [Fomes fomentarius]